MRALLIATIALCLPGFAQAAIDAYPFPNEELEVRYNQLIDELRCPQCLNTNLAGSDAMIARDLRREVHRLLLEGRTDEEILNFMHARYGDFILYEPRVTPGTFALWYGPLVLLMIGAGIIARVVYVRRERDTQKETDLSGAEQDRLKRLLTDPSDPAG